MSSLREKQLLKRKISKEHNSNFRAGYVQVNEKHLHRTGIRGKKQYVVFGLITLLLLVALANVLVTVSILMILRIDHHGMQSLEIGRHGELIRFLGDAELEIVHLNQNTISGSEGGIDIGGIDDYPLVLKINDRDVSTMSIDDKGIHFDGVDDFVILHPKTGQFVFTTDFEHFRFPEKVRKLDTKKVKTNRILSGEDEDLNLTTDNSVNGDINLHGAYNVSLEANQVSLTSLESVTMVTNGSLHLLSGNGIVLKSFHHMPLNPSAQVSPGVLAETYKLCICQENGKLFQVFAQSSCHDISERRSPCD